MKKNIKWLSAIVFFLIVLSFIFNKTSQLLARKYSYSKYAPFYEQKEDFDVLFLGTSHMLNAVFPMELWNDYGIVSYNLANYSETICTNYWQLVNALEHTTPKVVVVDLYAIDNDSKINEGVLHNFSDTIPSLITKTRMAVDLLPTKDWIEYIFDLSVYHSRWNELGEEDFNPKKTVEKGAELRKEVVMDTEPIIISREQYVNEARISKVYLQKIIDLCKTKNIDIVLTYLPYSAPEEHQKVANYGYLIAEQNNIPYLNFFYEDVKLNYLTDCADVGSHLNASGARKVTDYLGKYLSEKFQLEDRRIDKKYSGWIDDYQKYKEYKNEALKERDDDLLGCLMLLNDKELETTIYLTHDSRIYNDPLVEALLDNIQVFGKLKYEYLPDNYYSGNITLEVKTTNGENISTMNYNRVEENVYDLY